MQNRLSQESSAWLRAAADHPVHWQPWGADAFARARELERPVLLDIGAAWCHYCHVMDEECYKNADVARILNERYVAVRVDSDERPDLDARYQSAILQMTGLGGWPLTGFLTPDGDVFYGGTYFSLRPRGSQPGFLQIITWAAELYKSGPGKRAVEGRRLRDSIAAQARHRAAPAGAGDAEKQQKDLLRNAISRLLDCGDRRFGGFGDAPKFPYPSALELLNFAATHYNNFQARDFLRHTLLQMIRGGIHDRIGGGFHRYAVDGHFEIPHFEKLLSQNAEMLLVLSRTLAGGAAADPTGEIASAAAGIVNYILNTLQLRDGGFASSEAASAGNLEGDYYTWTRDELLQIAGADLAPLAQLAFEPDALGNFTERPGAHVLNLRMDAAPLGRRLSIPAGAARAQLRELELRLAAARALRARPPLDLTIIPAANALAASALLAAAQVAELAAPNAESYHFSIDAEAARAAATRAMELLFKNHPDSDFRRSPRASALLADQAAIAESCILLFEQGGEARWLARAEQILLKIIQQFWNPAARAFSDREMNHVELEGAAFPITPVEDTPHASGNALALRALARFLYHRSNSIINDRLQDLKTTLASLLLQSEPVATSAAACALAWSLLPVRRVVISGGDAASRRALRAAAFAAPSAVVVEISNPSAELAPELRALALAGSERSAAVICERETCSARIETPAELAEKLTR